MILNLLKTLATEMGSPSYMINTEQRQALHLSAVFINNFTNQLYRIAHELSDSKNINFEVLKPLILETAHKSTTHIRHTVRRRVLPSATTKSP